MLPGTGDGRATAATGGGKLDAVELMERRLWSVTCDVSVHKDEPTLGSEYEAQDTSNCHSKKRSLSNKKINHSYLKSSIIE